MNQKSETTSFFERYVKGATLKSMPQDFTNETRLFTLSSAIYLCEATRLQFTVTEKFNFVDNNVVPILQETIKRIRSLDRKVLELVNKHNKEGKVTIPNSEDEHIAEILKTFSALNKFIYLDVQAFKNICNSITRVNDAFALESFYKKCTSSYSVYGALYLAHSSPRAKIDFESIHKAFVAVNADTPNLQQLGLDTFKDYFNHLFLNTKTNTTLCNLEWRANHDTIFTDRLNEALIELCLSKLQPATLEK